MNLDQWRSQFAHVFQGWNAGSRGSRSAPSGATARHMPDAEGNFDYISSDFTKYGGETTSFGFALYGEHPADTEFIIIDQGSGVIELVNHFIIPVAETAVSLGLESIRVYCLQTHFHHDHQDGLPFNRLFLYRWLPVSVKFFSPNLRFYKKTFTPLSSLPGIPLTSKMMSQAFPESADEFPVNLGSLTANIEHLQFRVEQTLTLREDLHVRTCALPHPGGCCGYRIERAGYEPFVYMSDCDLGSNPTPELIKFQEGAGIVYHDMQYTDAQYDGVEPTRDGTILPRGRTEKTDGWGHNCPRNLLNAHESCAVPPRKVICGHHDPGHDDRDLDKIAHDLRKEAIKRRLNPKIFQLARGLGKTRPQISKVH